MSISVCFEINQINCFVFILPWEGMYQRRPRQATKKIIPTTTTAQPQQAKTQRREGLTHLDFIAGVKYNDERDTPTADHWQRERRPDADLSRAVQAEKHGQIEVDHVLLIRCHEAIISVFKRQVKGTFCFFTTNCNTTKKKKNQDHHQQ